MRFTSAFAAVAAVSLALTFTTATAEADSIPTQMSPACVAAIAALDDNVNAPCVAKHPYTGNGTSSFGSPEEKEAFKCECNTPGLLGYSQAIVDLCDVLIVPAILKYGWLDVLTATHIDQLTKFCGDVGVTINGTITRTPTSAAPTSTTTPFSTSKIPPNNSSSTTSPSYSASSPTNLVSSAAAISPFATPILVVAVAVVASYSL
ncbi:hypothetical protein DFJ73DRAFT_960727 [Zopfochytrium polystomum]|nr:hypothetical protein DFJ73DRAFT_960727 [Zopfochytrium polystomum]